MSFRVLVSIPVLETVGLNLLQKTLFSTLHLQQQILWDPLNRLKEQSVERRFGFISHDVTLMATNQSTGQHRWINEDTRMKQAEDLMELEASMVTTARQSGRSFSVAPLEFDISFIPVSAAKVNRIHSKGLITSRIF